MEKGEGIGGRDCVRKSAVLLGLESIPVLFR